MNKLTKLYLSTCTSNVGNNDSMFLYACELLTLELIWWNYYDAIKESEGERVLKI